MEEKRDKALLSIANDPHRLIKTNPIINARFDITAVQLKVFLKIIASIDQSLDDIPEIKLSVKEITKFIGSGSKNIHTYLQEELSKLRKKDINYEDENIRLESNFINTIVYHKKEGYFTFEIPSKIKPFILQIKENFTVIDIRNIMHLDSVYSIRFYEFCKEYERFKGFEYELEELKRIFGIENKYKNYYDFKLKVLNQARNELIKNSELYFDYEEVKAGKKVIKLRFKIRKNKKQVLTDVDPQIQEILELVKEYVPESVVKAWFDKYSYEQIKKGVEYGLGKLNGGKVKDVAAYMQKMVSMPEFVDSEKVLKEQKATKAKQKKAEKEISQLSHENVEKLKEMVYQEKVAIFRSLTQEDLSIQEQLIVKLRGGYFKSTYKDNLSFSENLKDPMLEGMLVGVAQDLFPQAFLSIASREIEIKKMEDGF
ncbi:replication initiation protein [Arundinibacter roseus]|uniref:RepB family plasmid replication initiator protein n=1 Tax=Arundinibacter roseus TaxID=2070510 RepID=A0A4R4JUW1_9BACT|nr:replication initiation protein [Arundinibacter roseus]TDB58537.1 RepB family plasmid replication initiator protein [Arundinibacter roseus]